MQFKEYISDAIGRTPLVKIHRLNPTKANIFAKIEAFNPMSSIKDRVAFNIIKQAENDGLIKNGTTIIEPTSGNTGIGLAYVCAIKGYRLIIVMPETMSIERQKLMKAFGAEVCLTDGNKGMLGSIEKANELHQTIKDSIIAGQFINEANPMIHRKTTAEEIWTDSEGEADIIIAGIGTGGTITGIGEVLKQRKPEIQIIGVEPEESAVLSGEDPGIHKIQGIGAGFIPSVMNVDILDEVIKISNKEAYDFTQELPKKEGILAGISSGAALAAAVKVGERKENEGKNIIVIFPDSGERYLSTDVFPA